MAALINTTEGYLAQMIGQLVMEKARLLGDLDKANTALEERKNDPDPGSVSVGPDVGATVARAPEG